MIACEVMFVEQRAGGSQGSSAIPPIQPSWLPGVL